MKKKPIDIDALVAAAVPPRENPQLAFTIPGLRVDSETNSREHWTKKRNRKKVQKAAVWAMWPRESNSAFLREVSCPCVVRFIRVGPKKLDDDNLAESFKACRDEVARQIGYDDGSDFINWEYAQVPVGKRVYQVRVEVY